MKFARFFGFFPAFLALVLLFSGCDALPTDKDDDNTTTKPNGSIFHLRNTDKKHIFISIYSTSGRQITLQAGDYFAVVVIPEEADGSVKYSGTPDLTGKLTAGTGGKFNFVPDDPKHEAGVGSISGNDLIMETVPGTTYKNLTLSFSKDATLSASKPFDNIDIPKPSGGDDGDDGDNNNNNSNEYQRSDVFTAGSYVTKVDFTSGPTFPSSVYEGTPVSVTGKAQVTYKDGTITKDVPVTDVYFIIEPPYYIKEGTEHTFTYIGDYNPEKKSLKAKVPTTNTTGSPATQFHFYKLNRVEFKGTENTKLFEGYGYDLTDVTITGYYKAFVGTNNTQTGSEMTNQPKSLYKYAMEEGTTLSLVFGDTSATGPSRKEKVSTYNGDTDKYELKEIKMITAHFGRQITFDDPRFFPGDPTGTSNSDTASTDVKEAKKYWYSHLADATIGLSYKDTTLQQTIKVVEAAMGYIPDGYNFVLKTPDDFKTDTTNNALTFEYGTTGSEISKKLAIPLYDKLADVDIVPIKSGPITLNGKNAHDESYFLSKVNVYAIYQIGENKSSAIKKPVFVGNKFDEFNYLCINGTYSSNVNEGGILNSGSSSAFDKKQKLQKAEIKLTAYAGNDTGTSGTLQTATGSLSIGVTGYN